MAEGEARTVSLLPRDGDEIRVSLEVAYMMGTVKSALEDAEGDEVVPISAVTRQTLLKVVEFCQYELGEGKDKEPEDAGRVRWEQQFLAMDNAALVDLILAANILFCEKLLDRACKEVADQLHGKTPQQIRDHFGIENDLTPEEEERIRKENSWCEEAF